MDRPGPRTQWLLFAAYAAGSVYFTFPVLASGNRLGIEDWDPSLFQYASVLRSMYEYGQLPFWNPWQCGGDVLWQNPQAPLLTPMYIFALIVPVPMAMKLTVLAHYLAGLFGMHVLLTRGFKLTFQPAIVYLGTVFAFAGGAALHVTVGHATFLPYFYLPWIVYCAIAGIESRRLVYAGGIALWMALSIYSGGFYLTVMMSVALAVFCTAAAMMRRDSCPLLLLAGAGVLTALLAAPKLVPVAMFLSDGHIVDIRAFPGGPERMTSAMVQHAFLDPFQYRRLRIDDAPYGWHEYGNYIGSLAVLLIVASLVLVLVDRPWQRSQWLGVSLALTCVMLFALMLGELGPYAPYALLRRLPILSKVRLPSRYALMLNGFGLALVASMAQRALNGWSAPARARWLVAFVLVAAAGSLTYRNRTHFDTAFVLPPIASEWRWLSRPPAPSIDTQTDAFAAVSAMYGGLMSNRAVLRCNEPLQLTGAVDATRPVVFAESERVSVSDIRFSPNRVSFRAVSDGPAKVFLNERYVAGWHAAGSSIAIDALTGLPYVTVAPESPGRFEFYFRPPGLVSGLTLAGIGLLASAFLWRRR